MQQQRPNEKTSLLATKANKSARNTTSTWLAVLAVTAVMALGAIFVAPHAVDKGFSKVSSAKWLYDFPKKYHPKFPSKSWGLSDTPGAKGTASFTLHSYCKTKEVKANYGDFWLDGEKEAYIVRHNYGSGKFFEPKDAVKMERAVLSEETGERGYVVSTDKVDFEFGFAIRSKATGEWVYEIGKGTKAFLYNEPCVQQYGAYWNRVRTSQPDKDNIEYVLGSCNVTCDPNYLDTANKVRAVDQEIPPAPGKLIVGKSNDARLFTLHSAKLGSWIRSASQRDTQFAESEDEARFIVAHVDAYGPDLRWDQGRLYLMMASIKVTKDAEDNIGLAVEGIKYYQWDEKCDTVGCSAAVYDLGAMW